MRKTLLSLIVSLLFCLPITGVTWAMPSDEPSLLVDGGSPNDHTIEMPSVADGSKTQIAMTDQTKIAVSDMGVAVEHVFVSGGSVMSYGTKPLTSGVCYSKPEVGWQK